MSRLWLDRHVRYESYLKAALDLQDVAPDLCPERHSDFTSCIPQVLSDQVAVLCLRGCLINPTRSAVREICQKLNPPRGSNQPPAASGQDEIPVPPR